MTDDELVPTAAVNQIIAQGRALVRAIAAMDTSVPGDPTERRRARLLQVEYRHRLRELLRAVPAWVAEEILGPLEQIEDDGGSGAPGGRD